MMGMGNINPQDIGVFSDEKGDVYYDKKTGRTLRIDFKKGLEMDVSKPLNRSPNALTPPDYYDESGMPVHEFKKGLDITIPAPTPTPSATPDRSPSNLGESADLKQMMGMSRRPMPSPTPEEDISPEDMEALKKILMGQGQMPSPAPAPTASPFRNIRGTIDRSK